MYAVSQDIASEQRTNTCKSKSRFIEISQNRPIQEEVYQLANHQYDWFSYFERRLKHKYNRKKPYTRMLVTIIAICCTTTVTMVLMGCKETNNQEDNPASTVKSEELIRTSQS